MKTGLTFKHILFLAALIFTASAGNGQTRWHSTEQAGQNIIHGQAFSEETRESFWHRLPVRAKEMVNADIWALSKHNAGESLVFTTDATEITVRYTVKGNHAMHHMPATGVSGVDLYTSDKSGKEVWLSAKCSFGDTITYRYSGIDLMEKAGPVQRYTLFLPLYNEVTWMEIGTNEKACFTFEKAREETPIVAYGSSICQGACASRPGMAWTNILQRYSGKTVVNLGFSGMAYFERPVMEIVSEIEACVYILDAIPNSYRLEAKELKDTIVNSIKFLRSRRPDTPILLVDHLGFPQGKAIRHFRESEKHAWETVNEAFKILKKDGIKKLYYLKAEEIALPADGTVEGIHPSDIGMLAYAKAYTAKLRKIINCKKE